MPSIRDTVARGLLPGLRNKRRPFVLRPPWFLTPSAEALHSERATTNHFAQTVASPSHDRTQFAQGCGCRHKRRFTLSPSLIKLNVAHRVRDCPTPSVDIRSPSGTATGYRAPCHSSRLRCRAGVDPDGVGGDTLPRTLECSLSYASGSSASAFGPVSGSHFTQSGRFRTSTFIHRQGARAPRFVDLCDLRWICTHLPHCQATDGHLPPILMAQAAYAAATRPRRSARRSRRDLRDLIDDDTAPHPKITNLLTVVKTLEANDATRQRSRAISGTILAANVSRD